MIEPDSETANVCGVSHEELESGNLTLLEESKKESVRLQEQLDRLKKEIHTLKQERMKNSPPPAQTGIGKNRRSSELESGLTSSVVRTTKTKTSNTTTLSDETADDVDSANNTLWRLSYFVDMHKPDSSDTQYGVTPAQRRFFHDDHERQKERILVQVRHRRFSLAREKKITMHTANKYRIERHVEELKDQISEDRIDIDDGKRNDTLPGLESYEELLRTESKNKKDTLGEAVLLDSTRAALFYLPRGGVYIQTSKCAVQFGIPPETIKDSLKMGLNVPTYFVVPKERFNLKLGINMCEVEFPAYFNFFLQHSSMNLLVTPDVEGIVRSVMEETLEGPEERYLYVDLEYPDETPARGRFAYTARPDQQKEIDFFKEPRNGRKISVDTLIHFIKFIPKPQGNKSEDGKSSKEVLLGDLGNGISVEDHGDEYYVFDEGVAVARVPSFLCDWAPSASYSRSPVPRNIVDPPEFGVTVLGSSHGFDPDGSTSGFVLWIHKKGIMVDPPPNATDILMRSGIIPSMITGVILTHCHADHDAGTFQKILKEGRITLMTTKTVFDSFIRKYSIISGFAEGFLLNLFEHRIVKIGEMVHWCGGTLRFFYALHALPCIGFEAFVSGKSFVYSADTLYDPKGLRTLKNRGIISEARYEGLMDFPWHYDVVLHESGIPPIHTPYTVLQQLPEDVRKRLYTIHMTGKAAEDAGLTLARAGVEHTIVIPTENNEHSNAASILQLLASTDLFKGFTIGQAGNLLQLCREKRYNSGEYICKVGEAGEHLFVILSGFCAVEINTEKVATDKSSSELVKKTSIDSKKDTPSFRKIFGAGDYLGEIALLDRTIRSASIVALTKVSLLRLNRHGFRYLMDANPGLEERMERLSKIRCSASWKAIDANSVFGKLGSVQRSQLQAVMHLIKVKKGEIFWRRDELVTRAYLVSQGELEFVEMREELDTPFVSGAFLCNVTSMMSQRTFDPVVLSAFEDQHRDEESFAPEDLRGGSEVFRRRQNSFKDEKAVQAISSNAGENRRKSVSKKVFTSRVTLAAKTDCELYYIEADDILQFLDQNPGIFINLIDSLVME